MAPAAYAQPAGGENGLQLLVTALVLSVHHQRRHHDEKLDVILGDDGYSVTGGRGPTAPAVCIENLLSGNKNANIVRRSWSNGVISVDTSLEKR